MELDYTDEEHIINFFREQGEANPTYDQTTSIAEEEARACQSRRPPLEADDVPAAKKPKTADAREPKEDEVPDLNEEEEDWWNTSAPSNRANLSKAVSKARLIEKRERQTKDVRVQAYLMEDSSTEEEELFAVTITIAKGRSLAQLQPALNRATAPFRPDRVPTLDSVIVPDKVLAMIFASESASSEVAQTLSSVEGIESIKVSTSKPTKESLTIRLSGPHLPRDLNEQQLSVALGTEYPVRDRRIFEAPDGNVVYYITVNDSEDVTRMMANNIAFVGTAAGSLAVQGNEASKRVLVNFKTGTRITTRLGQRILEKAKINYLLCYASQTVGRDGEPTAAKSIVVLFHSPTEAVQADERMTGKVYPALRLFNANAPKRGKGGRGRF